LDSDNKSVAGMRVYNLVEMFMDLLFFKCRQWNIYCQQETS